MQNGGLEPLVDLVKNCDVDGTGVGDAAGAIASLSTLQSGKRLTGIAKVSATETHEIKHLKCQIKVLEVI